MFKNMEDVKKANKALGDHWFSPDTMRFFNSRLESALYKGKYFITSEQRDGAPRMYTIRKAEEDGNITTVGDFQAYASLEDAEQDIEGLR